MATVEIYVEAHSVLIDNLMEFEFEGWNTWAGWHANFFSHGIFLTIVHDWLEIVG